MVPCLVRIGWRCPVEMCVCGALVIEIGIIHRVKDVEQLETFELSAFLKPLQILTSDVLLSTSFF